ncbi:MAG: hypothetical protein ACREPX_01595 [Rhodanobacteraceae bacterium]
MKTPNEDQAWIERARALLDRSTETLDAASLSRLNRARHLALAQRPRRRLWIVGTGLAAAAALVLCVGLALDASKRAPETPIAANALQPADIDVLTGDDDALDLYENLDFYAWLDEQGGDSNG